MSNNDLAYEFASTGGGNDDGFNNAAMEYFTGNPSYYLARESLQNILDAAVPGTESAIASFSSFNIKVHELPDHQKLNEIIKACHRYTELADPDNPEAKNFYINADRIFRGDPYLNILKIEDFNTTGMYGDDGDPSANYHKFMKSFGNSGKTVGSGGSFGFGKAAYYNASQLRMIFVSSIYYENGEKKYMFQGKLLLNSFDEDGDRKCGDGSFGFQRQKAVRDLKLIPEMFRRDEQGTTIFIVGFCDQHGWQKNILHSVLENFWPAVCDGRLEVKIGNDELINQDSLERIMKREYSPETPDKKDKPNPLPYFLAYTDDKAEITEKELDILGRVKLFTYIGAGLPNKTARARSSGMIVDKKGGYYCSKSHASFFYCESKDGSEILKRMENPRHDEWKAKNGPFINGKPDKELAEAEKELKEFINEVHYKLGSARKSESVSILNLDRYLYSPADEEFNPGENSEGSGISTEEVSKDETGSETGALENELKLKTEKINKPLKPVIIPDRKIKVKVDEKGEVDTWGEGEGGGNGKPQVPVTEDETGKERRVSIPINFRSFYPSEKKGIHILTFKNNDLGGEKIELEIFGVAERSGIIPLPVSEAADSVNSVLKTSANKIFITDPANAGTLKLKFEEHGRYSLLVEGYAYK